MMVKVRELVRSMVKIWIYLNFILEFKLLININILFLYLRK